MNSATPTKRLAIPPKPLKRATNSGMEVIFTSEEARTPTISPPVRAISKYS